MLLYLTMNTRPNIAFALSQVAQFTSNPKQSHASAVKMIIRYLSATSDQGIIFTPATVFKVDCYVDADFACLHGREPQDLSASGHSHTGYIMFFCSCLLIRKSQLQTETALSSFHAEYVALSSVIRRLITIQQVLQEFVHCLHLSCTTPVIHAEVFEDINSVYLLAMNHFLSEHPKHLNVKWHFFWEYVDEGSTDEQ